MKYTTKLIPVLLILQPLFAQAAGIQVSPARLDFIVPGNSQVSQNLTVVNPTADVQLFEVYPDDFTENVKAVPQSFTLEAGAKKTVAITVNPQTGSLQNQGQILSTNLSVVGKPLADNQKFSVGTGVKIPLNITLTAGSAPNNTKTPFAAILLAVAIIILGLWSFYIHKTANRKLA